MIFESVFFSWFHGTCFLLPDADILMFLSSISYFPRLCVEVCNFTLTTLQTLLHVYFIFSNKSVAITYIP